jgi:hypothetical protein
MGLLLKLYLREFGRALAAPGQREVKKWAAALGLFKPSPPPVAVKFVTLRVYLKQLSFALAEAAASDNPKVMDLVLALLERAGATALILPTRFTRLLTRWRAILRAIAITVGETAGTTLKFTHALACLHI